MSQKVTPFMGGLGIDATSKFEIQSNATVTVGDGTTTGNVVIGGKVGIGTSSPSTALDVTGTVTADGLTVSGATEFQDNPTITNGSPELTFETTNPAHANWQIAAQENVSDAFEIASGQQDADASDDTWTKRFTILNNGDISFYDSTGVTQGLYWDASTQRLGLGAPAPSALLHLAANAPYITFEDKDNNQDWQLQATAWFALRNQTTNEELLRVTHDGKVGIGTDSPSTTLDVAGNVSLGTNSSNTITLTGSIDLGTL